MDEIAKEIDALKEQNKALVKSVTMLSNTLHVLDAASLLSINSLIQTGNLRQFNFESNKDIQDSGCSSAIAKAFHTLAKVNRYEQSNKESDEGESA